jgi:predicted GTPase
MGYGQNQIDELAQTIGKAKCDLVISATPIDLGRLIQSNKKMLRVTYNLEEIGEPDLKAILKDY